MNSFQIENEKRFRTTFLLYGITSVKVMFDGSGDSGQIDEVIITPDDLKMYEIPISIFKKGDHSFDPELNKWVLGDIEEKAVTLKEAIE